MKYDLGRFHRSPINLENAKLGDALASRAADAYLTPSERALKLSVAEDRALSAVQSLIDRAISKVGLPTMLPRLSGTSRVLPQVRYLPKIEITWKKYELAFGLSVTQRRANGAARRHARQAFLRLAGIGVAEGRFFGTVEYARRSGQSVRIPHGSSKLFLILELTPELAGEPVQSSAHLPEVFTVVPSPFLLDGVPPQKPVDRQSEKPGRLYVLKPDKLHEGIRKALQDAGGPASNNRIELHLFLSKLMTRSERNYSPSVDKAMQFLCLDRKDTKKRRLERLQMALDVAYLLDFLVKPAEIKAQQIKMELNPNRIPKLKLGSKSRPRQD